MLHPNETPLAPALVERVLDRLGLPGRPPADLDGLHRVYAAWSQSVPFDNLRKLIHVESGDAGPLPGDRASEFLEAWLAWGCGGTCWAGNGALAMLLHTLGFEAARGVATMLVVPDLPPNHGTVIVTLDDRRWMVDASMIHGEPLLLDEDRDTAVAHPARGVRCRRIEGRWHVRWRPLHQADGMDCRLDALEADAAEYSERHDATRGWSPFNWQANARANRGDRVVGLAFGQRVEIGADGSITRTPVDHDARLRVMIDELGIAAELAERVPADRPTPPPPWSATAAAQD